MRTIAIYDQEDNLLTILEGYKAVGEYLNTSDKAISTHLCKKRRNKKMKKRANGKWYKLEEVDRSFWSDDNE